MESRGRAVLSFCNSTSTSQLHFYKEQQEHKVLSSFDEKQCLECIFVCTLVRALTAAPKGAFS